jgi:hypothetical protein
MKLMMRAKQKQFEHTWEDKESLTLLCLRLKLLLKALILLLKGSTCEESLTIGITKRDTVAIIGHTHDQRRVQDFESVYSNFERVQTKFFSPKPSFGALLSL